MQCWPQAVRPGNGNIHVAAAKSNLRDPNGQFYNMPFALYRNRHGVFDAVSPAGLGHRRPVWESIYHHYVNRKGIDAPYTARQVALLRPEGDGGKGDQLGVGTLTFAREPYSGTVRPSGLVAQPYGNAVMLSWWGCVGAERYIVMRSASMSAPYSVLASNIVEPTSFVDQDATPGTRFRFAGDAFFDGRIEDFRIYHGALNAAAIAALAQ